MLHNLTLEPRRRCGSRTTSTSSRPPRPQAKGITPARPIWMDVQNGETYPVFDVPRGGGKNGEYTYPDDAKDPYHGGPAKNVWTVDQDGTLLADRRPRAPRRACATTSGCNATARSCPTDKAKPGTTDTVHLFSSVSHYYEPAGPVSWDVTMSATPDNWRVQVHKGDKLAITATYESKHRVVVRGHGNHGRVDGARATRGTDPFTTSVNAPGILTHGHLPENDNHGGPTPDTKHYVDLTKLPSHMVPNGYVIDISNFTYASGDMSIATSVPTIKQGQSITFDNLDAPLGNGIWHTITDCAAAVRRRAAASRTRSPTARSCSTRVSSATAARRRRASSPGRRQPTCRPAPTRTGAGSTRSCGVRSASSPTDHVRRAFKFLLRRARRRRAGRRRFLGVVRVRRPRTRRSPSSARPDPPSAGGPATPDGRWRILGQPRDYVGYRIKELFGDAVLKRDAVGRTNAVTGSAHDRRQPGDDRGRERRRLEARQRPGSTRLLRPRQRAREHEVSRPRASR